jgi:hypothetical protein
MSSLAPVVCYIAESGFAKYCKLEDLTEEQKGWLTHYNDSCEADVPADVLYFIYTDTVWFGCGKNRKCPPGCAIDEFFCLQ